MPVNSRGQRVKTNKKNKQISDTESRLRKPKKSSWGGGAGSIGNGAAVGGN